MTYLFFAHPCLFILYIWNYFLSPWWRHLLHTGCKIWGLPADKIKDLFSNMTVSQSQFCWSEIQVGLARFCIQGLPKLKSKCRPTEFLLEIGVFPFIDRIQLIPFIDRIQFFAVVGLKSSLIFWLLACGPLSCVLFYPPSSNNTSTPHVLNLSDFFYHQTKKVLLLRAHVIW